MRVVYIAEADDGIIKVGISENPERRLEAMRYGPHGKCKLLHVIDPPEGIIAYHVEQGAHFLLKDCRVGGGNAIAMTEWFATTGDDALAAVHESANRLKEGDTEFYKRPRGTLLSVGLTRDLVKALDNWRRKQSVPPSRAAAIRTMIEMAFDDMEPTP